MSEIIEVSISAIKVEESKRRKVKPTKIKSLKMSIEKIGLQHPITLKPKAFSKGKYILVAGLHRLQSCKELGQKTIAATLVDSKTAAWWIDAENLNRNDGSVLDRAEGWVRQARLLAKEGDTGKGGKQPHEKGISRLAKELGVSRKVIGSAFKHASLPDSVKECLRETRLDNRANFLTLVASQKSEDDQFKLIDERRKTKSKQNSFATAKKRRSRAEKRVSLNSQRLKDDEWSDVVPDATEDKLRDLEQAWRISTVRSLYELADREVQLAFLKRIGSE